MQPIRNFRVIKKTCVSPDLCRVILEPADGERVFVFQAGQFIMLQALSKGDQAKRARAFSIASAPCESSLKLELGVKAQGEISSGLHGAELGDMYGVQGPYGTFVLKKDSSGTVFFAGGVGVTPIRSQIRESLLTGLNQNLVLFYSGSYLTDLMYHAEFSELSAKYPNFKYIPILTRESPAGWHGESGRLNEQQCSKYINNFADYDYAMCGPQPYMDEVRNILLSQGVDLAGKLRFERY
ncbi:MAG TPA: FAD-binding oxidoreductase [bacterium]|mgnify:CR=1 FL=1|nr:MAG: Phenol hydroxylase P5 protein [Parcubacteria group bacterium ADurb.Bin192]HPN14791.1 FAD-binding oxidoreductase [bacterium]